MGVPVIYLSAAPIDLRTHRAQAEKILTGAGFQVVMLEAGRFQVWSEIRKNLRKNLRNCTAVIHLAGGCYGSEPRERPPGAPRRSHAQMEYHLARDLRIPTYTFVLPEEFPFDAHSCESVELEQLQYEHRRYLISLSGASGGVTSTTELEDRLRALVHTLLEKSRAKPPSPDPAPRHAGWAWLMRLPLAVLLMVFALNLWQSSRSRDPRVTRHAPGSLLAGLSPDQIAAEQERAVVGVFEIRQLAREVAQIAPYQGTLREQYDSRTKLELAIASVAGRHGKKAPALQVEIEEWAQPALASPETSLLDKGLAAYLLSDYETAARYAGRFATAAEAESPPHHPQALSGWLLLGHSQLQQLKFQDALGSYRRALAHTNADQYPLIWSDIGLAEAYALLHLGRWEEAQASLRTSIGFRSTYLPPDAPEIAWAMTCLASLYVVLDRIEEAESLLRESRKILEQRFGPEHTEVADILANLGEVLRISGNAPEAERVLCASIAVYEKLLGKDTAEASRVLGSLSRLLADTGRHSEAVLLCERAVAIDERCFGPEHPRVARDLTNLALVLAGENHAEAVTLQRRSLAIIEKQFGPAHAETASALNNLAGLTQQGEDAAEAEQMFRKALVMDETVFGKNHPSLVRDIRNLASYLRHTGRHGEAVPLYLRGLALSQEYYGKESVETMISLRHLAVLLAEVGRPAEAEPLQRRASAIAERVFGSDHPEVARCARDLAFCLGILGKLEEAASLYEKAQGIATKHFGADHISVFLDERNRAAVYRDAGDRQKALEGYRRTYAMARRIFGHEQSETLLEMDKLASMLRDTKHYEEAEYLFRDLLAVREKQGGATSVELANDLSDLAGVLILDKRPAEAEPLYKRTLELLATASRKERQPHPLLETARRNYRSALQKLGLTEEQIIARMKKVETGEKVEDLASTTAHG